MVIKAMTPRVRPKANKPVWQPAADHETVSGSSIGLLVQLADEALWENDPIERGPVDAWGRSVEIVEAEIVEDDEAPALPQRSVEVEVPDFAEWDDLDATRPRFSTTLPLDPDATRVRPRVIAPEGPAPSRREVARHGASGSAVVLASGPGRDLSAPVTVESEGKVAAKPSRTKLLVVAASVVAAATLIVGGGAVYDHNQATAAATAYDQELATALDLREETNDYLDQAMATPLANLNALLETATATLSASAGQVNDESARQNLQGAMDLASTAIASGVAPVYGHEVTIEGVCQERPTRTIGVATAISPSPSTVRDHSVALAEAIAAVEAARSQWAYDQLVSTVVYGRDQILNPTAGQVADESLRQTLATAVAHGDAVLATGIGGTSVEDTLAAKASIDEGAGLVVASNGQWRAAEDARIAAEQAAAAPPA